MGVAMTWKMKDEMDVGMWGWCCDDDDSSNGWTFMTACTSALVAGVTTLACTLVAINISHV